MRKGYGTIGVKVGNPGGISEMPSVIASVAVRRIVGSEWSKRYGPDAEFDMEIQ